jgi:hypothetical protein
MLFIVLPSPFPAVPTTRDADPLPSSADLAAATIAISLWTIFLLHVMNAERLSSSVLRQVQYQLRNSEDVKALIGDGVRYAENWWGES